MQYHQRYNRNLVGDEHQELEAHLRARRLRAHRLTLATMASEMSSAEVSVEGSRGNLSSPAVVSDGTAAATVAAAFAAGVEQLVDSRPSAVQYRRGSSSVQKSAYTWLSLAHRRRSLMRKQKSGSVDGRTLRPSLKLERQSAVTEEVSDENADHTKSDSGSAKTPSREGSQPPQLPSSQSQPEEPEVKLSPERKSPDDKTRETSF